MENLHDAVRRAVVALFKLELELDGDDVEIRRRVRLNLELQLLSLLTLERELRSGGLSRRVWSMGQASIPVLLTSLKAIKKQAGEIELVTIAECQHAVAALDVELAHHAENR